VISVNFYQFHFISFDRPIRLSSAVIVAENKKVYLTQRQAHDSLGIYIGHNSLNYPSLRNAQQYQRNLDIAEKYFQCAVQFHRRQCVSIFIRLAVVASHICEVTQNSEKIWTYSSSRSSKVIDLGANRKRICDFLLVRHSNRGHILHRLWDTATYWLKIAYFYYLSLSLIRRPLSLCSLWNFAVKLTLTVRKLESWGYTLWWKLHDPIPF